MTTKNLKYYLSAPSPSKKPGFVLFRSKENDLFYFHFNNENGEPIFYSQGSTAVSKRDKKIEAVKKNAAILKRYKVEKEGDQYFFTLRAGNFQEIGRSRAFPTKTEMKKVMDYFIEKASEVQVSKAPVSKVSKPKETQKKQAQQTDEQFALKYSYQIHLYPSNEEKLINGRIINTRTERKGTFTGLDGQALVDFMKEDLLAKMPALSLSVSSGKPEPDEMAKSKEQPSAPKSQQKPQGIVLADPPTNLQLTILNKITGKPSNTLSSGKLYEVQLSPMENTKTSLPKTGEAIPFEISIKAIKGSNFSNSWTENMVLSSDGSMRLSTFPEFPYPGIYRMTAKSAKNQDGKSSLCGISVVNII